MIVHPTCSIYLRHGSFILKRYSKPRSVHGVVELVVDHLHLHMARNLGPLLPRPYVLIGPYPTHLRRYLGKYLPGPLHP